MTSERRRFSERMASLRVAPVSARRCRNAMAPEVRSGLGERDAVDRRVQLAVAGTAESVSIGVG